MSFVPLIEKVTVPEGTIGPWSVQRFEVTESEAKIGTLRSAFNGRGAITPGIYTQLRHQRRGLIMSDTPDEMRDHYPAVRHARDHVLINGLGLGMVLATILKKSDVARVTVIEISDDLIQLVGPHYMGDPRVEIVHADAFEYQPPRGARYGAVWHDIWDDLCGDNLEPMTRLKRKYGRRADWQGCWGEDYIRHQLQRRR